MKKKAAGSAIMTMLITVSAIGCSSTQPAGTDSKGAAGGTGKKLGVTAMKYIYGDIPPSDGRGIKMINERFNVDYSVNLVPQGTYDEKLTAVLASGKIPDMIMLQSGDLTNRYNKFAKQGAFLALDEYIKQYPTFQRIPQFVLDQFKVNGKVYAIPGYYPRFGFTVLLRKDWLDSLNLKVPTNYDELKQVAIAFTKNDPDKNGKNDTYGLAIGKDINHPIPMGAYWDPDAWYHKDAQGRFIPGMISNARKDMIQWFADLYKEGAMTRDFVSLDWGATNKEFYSGKAGIFIATPRGMSQQYMESLLQINPKAEFVHLEPFKAPDGSQGFASNRGFLGMTAISAEAGKDPVKVKRILEMLDLGRTFFGNEQKNDKNKDYDWLYGNLGQGYELKDGIGVAKTTAQAQGTAPISYLTDGVGYPLKDSDVDYPKLYSLPIMSKLIENISKTYSTMKYYKNPALTVVSETDLAKGAELKKYLLDEQSKMIAGQRPISDWNKMVDEWKSKGGEQLIKETNSGITIKDAKEAWE
ncbi:extracellular solute-binding protein [Paenibacillus allorhizosphaerae]|uniref:Lipoprotein LipO n=1 Tax=Paenibacillus allorhizosphaerae TaxID=2849866 RepID=A0ABN7TUT6_9BACL|nr:extracellular solute-binding protein [Paenibacillus allorhizosphaerae]CAG7652506.1 Lipoprotein LipO [Paenibacillus allorhizosphaerae]